MNIVVHKDHGLFSAFSTCSQSRVQTSANIQGENHTHVGQGQQERE